MASPSSSRLAQQYSQEERSVSQAEAPDMAPTEASLVPLARPRSSRGSSTSAPAGGGREALGAIGQRTASFWRRVLDAQAERDDDLLVTDHSTAHETLLLLALLDAPSASAPIPAATLELLRKTAAETTRRLVVSLRLPWLCEAIQDQRRRKSSFSRLQETLGVLYMEAEKGKQDSGRLLMVVDIVVEGWGERLDSWGWSDIVKSDNWDAAGRTPPDTNEVEGEGPTYDTVALGGTFDHLHSGHRILLTMAAWLATERIIVGITDDPLLQKKKHLPLLQPLSHRSTLVHRFLTLISPNLRLNLPPLQDIFGPTVTDRNIQALVVSRETIAGADSIDAERKKKGYPTLERFVVEVVGSQGETAVEGEGEEMQKLKMGSTAIRGWIAQQLEARTSPKIGTSGLAT